MTNSLRTRLAEHALIIGTMLLGWIFLTLLLTTGLFFSHQSISRWNFVIPSLATIALAGWIVKKYHRNDPRLFWIGCSATALILAFSILISARVYDNSWDGQDYQQRAVIALANGFNPVYQINQPQTTYYNIPLNHYPKAPWLVAAVIYKTTGSLESGKALPLTFIFISFLIVFAYLCSIERLNLAQISLLALLAAFNPVTANQFLSFYIDGLVSSTLLLSIVLMLWATSPHGNKTVALALLCSVVIGLNIKFTGTAYVGIILAVLGAYAVIRYRRNIAANQPLRDGLIALSLAGFFGLFLIGYNPYVLNTIRHHNPLYPIYGGDENFNKDFVMSNQAPQEFEGKSWYHKLFRSIFSKSGNVMWDATTELKRPFTYTEDELEAFGAPDLRIGGFGPLFSGIVLLACLCMGLVLLWNRWIFLASGSLALLMLLTALANEANWWARYTPQVWLIPLIVLAGTWMVKHKLAQLAGSVLAVAMALNLYLMTSAYIDANVSISQEIDQALHSMALSDEQYLVFIGPFAPWEIKLQRYAIQYQLVKSANQLPCPQKVQHIIYSPSDCP